jgi:hypothetical protein
MAHSPHVALKYFTDRFPDTKYISLETTTVSKWAFECPTGHQHSISKNAFLERIKGLKQNENGESKFRYMCSVCEKEVGKVSKTNKWKEVCEKQGFTFESYDSVTRIVKYLCKCGNPTQNQDSHVASFTGCKKCFQMSNRLLLSDVQKIFEEARCSLVTTQYTDNKQKLRYICRCGKEGATILHDFKNGARCGQCKVERTKETVRTLYGVDNVGQLQESKDKSVITCLKSYGVSHHAKAPEVQAKKEATCLTNNGVKCILSTEAVQKMAGDAMEAKHGVRHGLQIPEVMERIRQNNILEFGTEYPFQSQKFWDRWTEKNMKLYGVKFHTQIASWKEKCKAICMEKYGVEYPMHCPEIFHRATKSMFSSKPYTLPSKKVISLMGYEWMAFDVLLGISKSSKYKGSICTEEQCTDIVPNISYLDETGDKMRMYYPDICVKRDGTLLIIEVKSLHTFNKTVERNNCKFSQAAKLYPFQVWIFTGKKTIADIITYYPDLEPTFSSGKVYTGKVITLKKGTESCEMCYEEEMEREFDEFQDKLCDIFEEQI